jgi:hypothetical protein
LDQPDAGDGGGDAHLPTNRDLVSAEKTKAGRSKRSMPKNLSKVQPPLVLRLIRLEAAGGNEIFLLTNLTNPRKLSNHAAAKMYRLRWGMAQPAPKSPDRAQMQWRSFCNCD